MEKTGAGKKKPRGTNCQGRGGVVPKTSKKSNGTGKGKRGATTPTTSYSLWFWGGGLGTKGNHP